jgi:hypothetical protein
MGFQQIVTLPTSGCNWKFRDFDKPGMEAIWRIIIDDKGNDFFKELNLG